MNPIKVEVLGKPWLGRVIGVSEKFGVEIEFLKVSKRISQRYNVYEITEPGIYKHEPREVTIGSRRRDTGFVRVTEDGTVTEITDVEAKEAGKEMQIAMDAAKNFQTENNPLSKYSDVELLAEITRRGLR